MRLVELGAQATIVKPRSLKRPFLGAEIQYTELLAKVLPTMITYGETIEDSDGNNPVSKYFSYRVTES